MSTRKTLSERIDEELAKKAQTEAKIKELQQKQKADERNKRTHRICTRGGMIEGMLPDTIGLTDEQFRMFLEKTTANSYGQRTLAEIIAGKLNRTLSPAATVRRRNKQAVSSISHQT